MDDDLTPEQFRAAMAAGAPAVVSQAPRPALVTSIYAGAHLITGQGGGIAADRGRVVSSSSSGLVTVPIG